MNFSDRESRAGEAGAFPALENYRPLLYNLFYHFAEMR